MKIALISDVHGNLLALDACLVALKRLGVGEVHFLGDATGYFPDEVPVIERLLAETVACQQGNHEALLLSPTPRSEALEDVYRLGAARNRLRGTALWQAVAQWPVRREVRLGGRNMLFVHGSPQDPLFGYVYPDTDLAPYAAIAHDCVVMANTHHPSIREHGGKRFVNVGSVGLPRDHGNLAAFAVYDDSEDSFRIIRVPLDIAGILARYENHAARAVLECFRRSSSSFVGEVLS
jgi:predicted phosphodiesterase